MVPVSQRRDLHRWPAMEVLGRAAEAHLGHALAEIELAEVYSCFPAAVRVQQRALRLPSTESRRIRAARRSPAARGTTSCSREPRQPSSASRAGPEVHGPRDDRERTVEQAGSPSTRPNLAPSRCSSQILPTTPTVQRHVSTRLPGTGAQLESRHTPSAMSARSPPPGPSSPIPPMANGAWRHPTMPTWPAGDTRGDDRADRTRRRGPARGFERLGEPEVLPTPT